MTPADRKKRAAVLQAALPPGDDVWERALAALTRELDAAQRDAAKDVSPPVLQWLAEFTVPVALVSEANTPGHWTDGHARHKVQKETTLAVWHKHCGKLPKATWQPPNKVVVRIVRHGKKRMDSDNLWGSAKYVRDPIAYGMGVDDGAAHLDWQVDQVVNPRATPKVVVLVGLVVP